MIDKTENEIMKHWRVSSSLPLVSISCASYNHERYISDALDSFLAQETNFPFEIVVGEDCSTDKTRNIILEYQIKYPNIVKPILWDKNVGAHRNWNTIVETCKGEYIANCEGDDYWSSSQKLQTQIDAMCKFPHINLSFHLSSRLYENNREIKPKLKKKNQIYSLSEMIKSDFHFVQTNTIMFKKESLKKLNMNIMKDSPVGDVWIKIATSMPNGAIFINKAMSVYRVQSVGSWSANMLDDDNFLVFLEKMMKVIDRFDKDWSYEYSKELRFYKNKYIKILMYNTSINIEKKNNFFKKNKDMIYAKNLLAWKLLFSNTNIVKILKGSKIFIKGIIKND